MKKKIQKTRIRKADRAGISARAKKFIVEKVKGKTDYAAARAAGFAESTSRNTKQRIWAQTGVQALFRKSLRKAIIPKLIVRRLREGLDAIVERTTISKDFAGRTAASKTKYISHTERRKYIELIVRLGLYVPKEDLPIPDAEGPDLSSLKTEELEILHAIADRISPPADEGKN